MRLYIVFARDPNGESLDWFVRAPSPERALAIWQTIEMVADNGFTDYSVHEVPAVEGPEGAIEWESSLIAI